MKVKLLLTAITLSCLAIDVLAQVSISGKIVSADTNEPLKILIMQLYCLLKIILKNHLL